MFILHKSESPSELPAHRRLGSGSAENQRARRLLEGLRARPGQVRAAGGGQGEQGAVRTLLPRRRRADHVGTCADVEARERLIVQAGVGRSKDRGTV